MLYLKSIHLTIDYLTVNVISTLKSSFLKIYTIYLLDHLSKSTAYKEYYSQILMMRFDKANKESVNRKYEIRLVHV